MTAPLDPMAEAVEMRMCEIAHLILHPNQLYRFTVAPGCGACEAYINPALARPSDDTRRIAVALYGESWLAGKMLTADDLIEHIAEVRRQDRSAARATVDDIRRAINAGAGQ